MNSIVRLAALTLACACGTQHFVEPALIPKNELALGGRALSGSESDVLTKNGFAILEQGTPRSFHVGYTTIFHAHQPVYVTADSLLYAWHSSYDAILMNVEMSGLIDEVHGFLDNVRAKLAASNDAARAQGDLDVYLAVALGLLDGNVAKPVAGGSPLDVAQLTKLGEDAAGPASISLFGATRPFDFSMLKPRGHYTFAAKLEGYFRAMSWLGRAELRLAHKDRDRPWTVNRRALHAAVLLEGLMRGEATAAWQRVDALLGAFVGPNDSMSVPALHRASASLRLGERPSFDDVERLSDADVVAAFEAPSRQKIRTQMATASEQSIALLLFGQRYVFDAQVLSDLTYGSLETDPPRLMPSPLDVGFAVFHAGAARKLLDPETKRYGAAYTSALEGAAAQATSGDPALWQSSFHHRWLGALRELTPNPERDAKLPAPLRSEAWERRMLGAQLASWAELRHDDLLYAKQSVTAMILCGYPYGYVDPYPDFYEAMEHIADHGLAVVASDPTLQKQAPPLSRFFGGMKQTMSRLRAIAAREQADEPMTADDLDFLNHMVSIDGKSGGCGGPIAEASGWYADLYFDSGKILWHQPIIADVHTQMTDEQGNMVGRVLHVATGKPRMLVVTLQHDGGKSPTTYRGFVSSYAEKIADNFVRYTDEQWGAEIAKQPPAVVPWMRDIVAP